MNKQQIFTIRTVVTVALLAAAACSERIDEVGVGHESLPLQLSGQIVQENITRANDRGFVTGDRMGIYVVDRKGTEAGEFGAVDNRASNVLFTYDGEQYQWTAPTQIYWRDRETPVDVYGYYPGVNYIATPTAYEFSVQTDQSTEGKNGDLSGYEQSDLLWGKAANISFTTDQIVVRYSHILAGVRVELVKGESISNTEWQKLEKIVLVDNTVITATVDLSTGMTSRLGNVVSPICMAPQANDQYRAIVIPQTVAAQKQLLSITLDGRTYSHSLGKTMQYEAGKLHTFTMTVEKNEQPGDYDVTVSDQGITPWENDQSSHQFTANAYIVVNCSEPGRLEENIRQAGYDPQAVQNLKVTGKMTTEDFQLLRNGMPELKHLNLKDVRVVHAYLGEDFFDSHMHYYYQDNAIPANAFYGQHSIRSMVLPSSIKVLASNCLCDMRLMFSTLEIPEGVTTIREGAVSKNEYNGVELILPNTIDSIYGSAFRDCGYECELKFNDNISYIGEGAFSGQCPNFYGVFHLPSKIKELYAGMFSGLGQKGTFSGTIELPQGLVETPDYNYWGSWGPGLSNRIEIILPSSMKRVGNLSLGGALTKLQLNEGLEEIGSGNFKYYDGINPFPIILPSTLQRIDGDCFRGGYEGELTIPEGCLSIGAGCFCANAFTKINLPSKLEIINQECFRDNGMLTSITIPRYVEYIGQGAFDGCNALQTVICLAQDPPELGGPIFQGVFFDKCVLQVPEASIEKYRHTDGWKQFRNITAYHELAFNVPEILCLDKGQTAEGVIRAEGAWEISECPDWVTVSPMSGTAAERKAELTVTVKPLDASNADREGRIVFQLKDKGYMTYTTVRQRCLGDIREDQKVVLQTASAGAQHAIPIFIVGEGYDADDIASGQYLEDMRAQMEYLFSCEPYKTYRNYFTVSTAIAVSPEHGINGRTRFEPENPWEGKDEVVWQYAKAHGEGITEERAGQTTIIVLYNSNYLGDNRSSLRDDGRTISYLGKSTDSYPFEQRSFVLREVGGVAFGHLGVEGINHFTFLKACTCPNCNGWCNYTHAKSLGWYENISVSGKMNEVPWGHLIFDERYAQQVDVYEGGYNHARGVYRSENMSIMGSQFIPYFNTISRQSIVKRILEYSGEGYTFEKFVAKDKREYPESE